MSETPPVSLAGQGAQRTVPSVLDERTARASWDYEFKQSRLHRLADRWAHLVFLLCSLLVVLLICGILYFLAIRGAGAFVRIGTGTDTLVTFKDVFLSTQWSPFEGKFGVLPFIGGTAAVTVFALILAAPTGILTGVFISQLAPTWMKNVMRQVMDLLVGIPSVVYGIFGLTIVLPWVGHTFLQDSPAAGFGVAGAILAVMIIPTIVSLATDAFEGLSSSLNEGSQALGSTTWQAIWHVLIPAAKGRLLTAIVLGLGRALGEAMAVQMVIGNNPQWLLLMKMLTDKSPILRFLFTPAATLTTELVQELPNTAAGSTWNNVLFALGFLLYLITMVLIVATRRLGQRKAA
nr:phosphate ABC transporter permease subunit PstC [uncultured Holophaga sp.]